MELPSGKTLPEKIFANSFFDILEKSKFNSLASFSFNIINSGS